MRSFASDNNSTVHPRVMEALQEANQNHAYGYGEDPWTERAETMVQALFRRTCKPFFVFNGTGSNTMALQLLTRPYTLIYTAATGHIAVDECGAPAKATGCMLCTIETPDGKLTPDLIAPHVKDVGVEHHSQPGAIYISQCTELGTIYTPQEVKALCDYAHANSMRVHMDGARIANAAVALNVSIDQLSGECGVDTLTLGGTKNGLMGAECVVVFDQSAVSAAPYVRKQTCQLASKSRFLAAQFIAYLSDDLWRTCAEHANAMAQRLYKGLKQLPYVQFTQRVESNQLFFTLPPDVAIRLAEHYHFYFWNESIGELRLVTSHDTTIEDVEGLLSCVKGKAEGRG